MFAAVVRSFDRPPRYERFETPQATGEHQVGAEVLAAGLHPRVRSAADGSHYESTGELPLIPGIDGVGRTDDGQLVYFVVPDGAMGSMAERVVIDRRRSVQLPDEIDPVAIAAAMNPAMSSWIALRKRITFQAGQSVLVLGATGNAGQLAVQIAKHLGARNVIAAGRSQTRLAKLRELGADRIVVLPADPDDGYEELGVAADQANIDVVLDYLWGSVTEHTIPAIIAARSDRGRPLDWIEIGSMAGLQLELQSRWLRAARLQLVGSGQGSVETADIVAELPALAQHIATRDYAVNAIPTPLADIEAAWARPQTTDQRIVFTP